MCYRQALPSRQLANRYIRLSKTAYRYFHRSHIVNMIGLLHQQDYSNLKQVFSLNLYSRYDDWPLNNICICIFLAFYIPKQRKIPQKCIFGQPREYLSVWLTLILLTFQTCRIRFQKLINHLKKKRPSWLFSNEFLADVSRDGKQFGLFWINYKLPQSMIHKW